MLSRLALPFLLLAAGLGPIPAEATSGSVSVLLESGDRLDSGVVAVPGIEPPWINDAGAVLATVRVDADGLPRDTAYVRLNSGVATTLITEATAASRLGVATVTSLAPEELLADGRVAMRTGFRDFAGGVQDSGYFLVDSTNAAFELRTNRASDARRLTSFQTVLREPSGELVFDGEYRAPSPAFDTFEEGIYRLLPNDAAARDVVLEGSAYSTAAFVDRAKLEALGPDGHLVVSALIYNPTLDQGFQAVWSVSPEGTFTELYRDGQAIGDVTPRELESLVGGSDGSVSYATRVSGGQWGLFSIAGDEVSVLQFLPDADGIAESNEVFGVNARASANGRAVAAVEFADNIDALVLADPFTSQTLAREGTAAPGGGFFTDRLDGVTLDESGRAVWQASYAAIPFGPGIGNAIYAYTEADGVERLVGVGDTLLGQAIDGVGFAGENAVNDRGQVAFSFALDDGRAGVAVWSASAPGDFNGDGIVGWQDYATWQTTYGDGVPAFEAADANGDGLVNAADYTVWRDALNAPDAPSIVPEPTALVLFAASALLLPRRMTK